MFIRTSGDANGITKAEALAILGVHESRFCMNWVGRTITYEIPVLMRCLSGAVTNDRPDGLPTPVHHRRADGPRRSSNENQHCNLSSPTKEI
jgi:hypothetical protein